MLGSRKIAAVILAAGYSSRMGAFKPLLRLGEYTAVEMAINSFLKADVIDIRVVAGYRVEDLLTAVKPLPVKVIFNPHFDRGMYSSVQVAVGSLEPEIEAFFILPVDIPLVSAETIRKMVEAFGKSYAPKIIYPVYNGRRGHPPLIWAGYKEEIIGEIQLEGLRSFLNKHEPHAFELTVADEAVLLEMDTLEEYRRLLRLLEHPLSLSVDESLFLLEKLQPHEKVRRHCKVVAALACLVVRQLKNKGAHLELNEDAVVTGALLHDLAREEKNHALAAAELLKKRGCTQAAEIIASHMDIEVNPQAPLSEAEIVFLADKMVQEEKLVSLEERFASRLANIGGDPEVMAAVVRRLKQARQIAKKVERALGETLEMLKTEQLNHFLKEWRITY